MSAPCKTCPWRRGSDSTKIPHFNNDQAKALEPVCERESARIMACHLSPQERPTVCHGFAQSSDAARHFGLRLATSWGLADGPQPPLDDCFQTYGQMAEHHGWFSDEPPPNNNDDNPARARLRRRRSSADNG